MTVRPSRPAAKPAPQPAAQKEKPPEELPPEVVAARRMADRPKPKDTTGPTIFGEDLNWGRIMAAAGKCGVPFRAERVDLYIGTIGLARGGAAADVDYGEASAVMREREIPVIVNLNAGEASATMWTSDLSLDYVRINAEYHT